MLCSCSHVSTTNLLLVLKSNHRGNLYIWNQLCSESDTIYAFYTILFYTSSSPAPNENIKHHTSGRPQTWRNVCVQELRICIYTSFLPASAVCLEKSHFKSVIIFSPFTFFWIPFCPYRTCRLPEQQVLCVSQALILLRGRNHKYLGIYETFEAAWDRLCSFSLLNVTFFCCFSSRQKHFF